MPVNVMIPDQGRSSRNDGSFGFIVGRVPTFRAFRKAGFHVPVPVGVLRTLSWRVGLARGQECPRYTQIRGSPGTAGMTPQWARAWFEICGRTSQEGDVRGIPSLRTERAGMGQAAWVGVFNDS
jgi:hypothetical protein